jgi:hypothetical protein
MLLFIAGCSTQPPEQRSVDSLFTWSYSSSEDKMGRHRQFAQIESKNAVLLGVPAGYNREATLVLRKTGAETAVLLTVTDGVLMCSDPCEVLVRFDYEEPTTFPASTNYGDPTSPLFISADRRAEFVKRLKKAKRLVIEAKLFQTSPFQFEFATAGLKWDEAM